MVRAADAGPMPVWTTITATFPMRPRHAVSAPHFPFRAPVSLRRNAPLSSGRAKVTATGAVGAGVCSEDKRRHSCGGGRGLKTHLRRTVADSRQAGIRRMTIFPPFSMAQPVCFCRVRKQSSHPEI